MKTIFMEFVKGHDLSHDSYQEEETLRGNLSAQNSLRILFDITSALDYLHHERRVLHNDIKPANIIFNEERGACLVDLGMASKVGENAIGGTSVYLAPEIQMD